MAGKLEKLSLVFEECDFCGKFMKEPCSKRSFAETCMQFDKEIADKILDYKIWYFKFFKNIDYKDE